MLSLLVCPSTGNSLETSFLCSEKSLENCYSTTSPHQADSLKQTGDAYRTYLSCTQAVETFQISAICSIKLGISMHVFEQLKQPIHFRTLKQPTILSFCYCSIRSFMILVLLEEPEENVCITTVYWKGSTCCKCIKISLDTSFQFFEIDLHRNKMHRQENSA